VAQENTGVNYMLRIIFVFLAFVMWPKLLGCLHGKGDVLPDFQNLIGGSSLRVSAGYGSNIVNHNISDLAQETTTTHSIYGDMKGVDACPYCKNLPPIAEIDVTDHEKQPKSRLSVSKNDLDEEDDSEFGNDS
jgi:hypothetical protein